MRKTQGIAAVAAMVLAGGAVIASNDRHDASDTVARVSPGAGLSREAANTGGGSTALDADASGAVVEGPGRVAAAEARVVKTAQLEVAMRSNEAVTGATAKANAIAEAHGGFVATTHEVKGEGRQTTLTVRVPVDRYEAALSELRGLGEVASESLGGKDVTGTLVDLEARLRTLRAQEEALNALVAKARTVGETLEVSREAANVRMQIEQLAAQQAQLADQADFATIDLRVVGPGVGSATQPGARPLLAGSVERAAAAALGVVGGVVILLGYLLPSAVLALLGFGVWRIVTRKRQAAAPVAS